ASQGLSPVLELDFQAKMRPSRSQSHDSISDPEDGSCQPALGSAPYPRGVAEAGYPHLGTNRVATPPQKTSTSFSNLEGVSRQSSEPTCFHRFLYGAHRRLSGSVRFGGFGPSSAQSGSFQRDRTSDGGLDRSANPGSVPGRHGATIFDPRSGPDLPGVFPQSPQRHGHHRSPDRTAKPLAKPICGEAGGLYPARVLRSHDRPRREPPAKNPEKLFRLLSAFENSPVFSQGRSDTSRRAGAGGGRDCGDPSGRRPAPSLRKAGGVTDGKLGLPLSYLDNCNLPRARRPLVGAKARPPP